jgi:hypothetical protein
LFPDKEAKNTEKTKEEVMAKLHSLNLDSEEEEYSTDEDFDNMSEHS